MRREENTIKFRANPNPSFWNFCETKSAIFLQWSNGYKWDETNNKVAIEIAPLFSTTQHSNPVTQFLQRSSLREKKVKCFSPLGNARYSGWLETHFHRETISFSMTTSKAKEKDLVFSVCRTCTQSYSKVIKGDFFPSSWPFAFRASIRIFSPGFWE